MAFADGFGDGWDRRAVNSPDLPSNQPNHGLRTPGVGGELAQEDCGGESPARMQLVFQMARQRRFS